MKVTISEMKVDLVDHMGSDLTVVNAARVSFHKESEWDVFPAEDERMNKRMLKESDAKLIRYLAKHNHWTPFGHCFVQFRVKAPIFVARQLVKHQVGLVWNEESRRYIDSEPEFWFPKIWRKRPDGSLKQGSGGEMELQNSWKTQSENMALGNLALYNHMINSGVAPEQARMVLPVNMMTEWYWSGSLAAWARVCKLRLDPHAQAETQEVAKMINSHMGLLFPVSWAELTS